MHHVRDNVLEGRLGPTGDILHMPDNRSHIIIIETLDVIRERGTLPPKPTSYGSLWKEIFHRKNWRSLIRHESPDETKKISFKLESTN